MEVAQVNSNSWAISARGFNTGSADKLLVLMDGRSVYSPLFSGVFWDVQDTMMEDIDRIEVIRGPAGRATGERPTRSMASSISSPRMLPIPRVCWFPAVVEPTAPRLCQRPLWLAACR